MKKKALAVFLALSMASAAAFCASAPVFADETEAASDEKSDKESGEKSEEKSDKKSEEKPDEKADKKTDKKSDEKTVSTEAYRELAPLMSYDEFLQAALDSPVTVETFVQAKQAWIEDASAANLYTQNEEGAYFIYKLPMTKKEYKKLKEGQKIRVSGRKHQWLGNIEIAEATYEILDGSSTAEAQDVTALLGTEDLAEYKNRKVSFKGLKSVDIEDPGGDLFRYAYGPDGNGDRGDDLYFCGEKDGEIYTFVVESRLFDSETKLYKAVEELEEDSMIDLEGFLYWERGALPHITAVTVTKTAEEAAAEEAAAGTTTEDGAEETAVE